MLDWRVPDIDMIKSVLSSRTDIKEAGSDTSALNILLLRDKYDTKVSVLHGSLVRYYNGKNDNRRGYGFPLCADKEALGDIFAEIRQDASDREIPLCFCLCDERQKALIDDYFRVKWQSFDGDCDYIYKRESLALLSGKKLHRKRNHINNFRKLYPEFVYKAISPGLKDDIIFVAEKWLSERDKLTDDSELLEFESIKTAAENIESLGLIGGVIYVDGVPAAMTVASEISPVCIDVHYEKAYGEYAQNGAFTAINQCFAASESALSYELINREEDMGIEGLRLAKESYYPAYKIKKYYGVCKC